jgi:hypothetical protein
MPTRRQVQKFASTLSDPFLSCRRYGHPWKDYTVERDGPRYKVTVICPSCESTRTQTLDRNGMILNTVPHYSKGYLAHGIGRISGEAKGVLRLEGVRRTLEGHEIQAQSIEPGSDVVTSISAAKRRRRAKA